MKRDNSIHLEFCNNKWLKERKKERKMAIQKKGDGDRDNQKTENKVIELQINYHILILGRRMGL